MCLRLGEDIHLPMHHDFNRMHVIAPFLMHAHLYRPMGPSI